MILPQPKLRLPLLATLLALLVAAAPAAASPAGGGIRPALEAGEGIENPGAQEAVVGATVAAPVKGAGLHELGLGKPLPEGLTLEKVSETEWKIVGKPAKSGVSEVELTGENAAKEALTPVKFTFTVGAVNKPAPQTATVGTAFEVVVSGVGLHTLTPKSLPEGLSLKEVSETEWKIAGKPLKAGAGEVELTGEDAAKEALPPVRFTFTVTGINKPAAQTATLGTAFEVVVSGTGLHALSAKGLPEGLKLEDPGSSETEWKILGTPTKAGVFEVELSGKDTEGRTLQPVLFQLTVEGINSPGPQRATLGTAIEVVVSGAGLRTLSAKALPDGLKLEEPGTETEWKIVGTPTKAGVFEVELSAKDAEGNTLPSVLPFTFTVTGPEVPPPPPPPTPTGTLAVTPSAALALARATCGGVSWSAATVAVQWLADGAPIPGATSASYFPPRAEDGHSISCRETAKASNGATASVTSPGVTVHEQPAQPVWPIGPAEQHCSTVVCMEDGNSAQTPATRSYPQEGSWYAASQVRCVSAPLTSMAGTSASAAIESLAEAHAVSITLQRITASGVLTLAAQELSSLTGPRDELDGSPATGSPFPGNIAVSYGTQAFASGELWARTFPGSVGRPDRFAAGQGYMAYELAGTTAVHRSFQLVYNLTAADLGAELRCVVSAKDGPVASPTTATFVSPEYAVATDSSCAPRRLGPVGGPQPLLALIGSRRCLPAASSGMAEIGGSQPNGAVLGGRVAVELECVASSGCTGNLGLAGRGGRSIAGAFVSLHRGGHRLITLKLTPRGRQLLQRAGAAGLPVSLTLRSHARTRTLFVLRLI